MRDPVPPPPARDDLHETMAAVQSLTPLLTPKAVAVVGASNHLDKMGGRILHALLAGGFTGRVYAVHPSDPSVQGVPTYRSARELPAGVDLAVVVVPAAAVPQVVDDCAAAAVRSLVVISAGFAETGAEGRAAEAALLDQVRGHGMRMVGPNCMGVLNLDPAVRLNASFAPILPGPGRIALGSQSGALGIAVLGLAAERHLGLSVFVSIGNKADVSSNDLLEYWENDPHTQVVLLYLESFGNPRRFARIARRVGRAKPVVALKAGRTRAGARAASSHTAALAGGDAAVDAVFHQTGIIRVETVEELFDVGACLDAQPLPAGPRLAVVTNAGGPGILAADACEAAGLTVTEFSPATRDRLRDALPAAASIGNPIDMVASAGGAEYRRAVEIALAAPESDMLLVIVTTVDPSHSVEILEGIRGAIAAGRTAGGSAKTIAACLVADRHPEPLGIGAETVPVFAFPENAVRALGKVAAYARWRAQPVGLFRTFDDIQPDRCRAICRKALFERGEGWLKTDEISGILHALGVPSAASALAHSAEEAAALASVIGFPVAAKLASTAISHKTELGAVRLSLTTPLEVKRAFAEMTARVRQEVPDAPVDGVVIQSMIADGIETLVGIAQDPVFGALVGFGLGGVNVEVTRDVRFRVAPLTDRDADDLLHEIRGVRLLQGYRGRHPADLEALRELLLRVSRLAEDVPEIAELDFNPVMALAPGQGCRVADARIRVAP